MCVSTGDTPYKCCCCIPLVCVAIIMAVCEGFNLFAAITFSDIYGIVISSIILLMFVISFIKPAHYQVRKSLFLTYLASLVLFAIYFLYFVFTEDMDKVIERSCDRITTFFSWDDCASDMESAIWAFIIAYAVLVFCVRGFFVHILWHYAQEANERHQDKTAAAYQTLSGKN